MAQDLSSFMFYVANSQKRNSPNCLELLRMSFWLFLHCREGFVYRDLATSQQNWATPGLLDCRIQRIRLDNGVPGGQRPCRAFADCSVACNSFCRRCKWIAPVYQVSPKFTEPGSPRLHDLCLFGFVR